MAPRSWWSWTLAASLLACSPARKEVDADIVRNVHFEGNGGPLSGHNDYQLRQQMAQNATKFGLTTWPFLYWVRPQVLDRTKLLADAYRLEVWYAHHGYFDAEVTGWEIRQVRRASRKQGTGKWGLADREAVFDVRAVVEPGPASIVKSYEIEGLDKTTSIHGRNLKRTGFVQEGDVFNLEYVETDRDELLRDLHKFAYAYAKVDMDLLANPRRRTVNITLDAEPGISTQFGKLSITGLERVPRRYIERTILLEEGESYNIEDLENLQQDLFETGLFTLVQVQPDLTDPTRRLVPIDVHFTETRFRTLRVGVGFEAENLALFRPRVSSRYRDVNVFGSLLRFEAESSLGFVVVTVDNQQTLRPTYALGSSLLYPRISPRFDLEFEARIEQDLLPGLWMYRRPSTDLAAVLRPNDDLTIRIGPHAEEYRYLDLEDGGRQPVSRLFGASGKFRNPYQITSLDQTITLDWRLPENLSESTSRGSLTTLSFREAAPLTEGGYAYLAGGAEWRYFRPIRLSRRSHDYGLVLATRLRGQGLLSLQDEPVPYPERAFMGGSTSVRGFRYNQVGPYDTLCIYDEGTIDALTGLASVEHYHLPQGGVVATDATIEVRHPGPYGVTVAGFLDVGVLTEEISTRTLGDLPQLLRWSGGIGTRYDSQVGPVRFDLSFRRLYPEDLGPDSFVGCREDDKEIRTPDFWGQFGEFRPPFAMVFFLAIGDAL